MVAARRRIGGRIGRVLASAMCVVALFVAPIVVAPIEDVAAADSLPSPSEPSSADPGQHLADPALRVEVDAALDQPNPGHQTVAVEVIATSTASVAAAVAALGGSVTGGVLGEVVQAEVPADHVAALALRVGQAVVRSPRLVTHPPGQRRMRPELGPEVGPGFGPVVGQNVGLINASAWQAAGIDGSVKIGIIDYFDLGLWNPPENGPVPDVGHRFCRDTSVAPELCDPANNNGINDGDGFEHGVAVAQVVRDVAPGAELFIASAGTVSDLQAAINWFASNGVQIVTRSLGAAYDGAGDGTGPLAAVVDSAAAQGMVWFNSGGNDAADGYARAVAGDLAATGGYVDFDNGPNVDTWLRVSGSCVLLDGIRWNDWDKPAELRTDYTVEVWAPVSNPDATHSETFNPADVVILATFDADQGSGAPPLEGVDDVICPSNAFGFAKGISYLRIHRKAGSPTAGAPDIVEVGLSDGFLELGRSQAAYSAAKPVVDSRNPQLIAVGAVDPANGTGSPQAIGAYSSQGPTNDGRIKPDVSAPSCVASTLYPTTCFNGTSAAAPTVAGIAALLLDAGVALPGVTLAAAVRHFAADRNAANGSLAAPDGPDNKYGTGQVLLPSAPTVAPPVAPAAYQPLTPQRVLDTRVANPVGPANLIGALRAYGIVDVPIAGVGSVPGAATAVAVNITSTDTIGSSYIQAVPFLRTAYGTSSTLNVASPGAVTPNFAIVPVGVDGKISIYSVPGGNIVIDVLGYFLPTTPTVAAGRFVAIDPVRTLDTRTAQLVPAGWVPHQPNGESVIVPSTPSVPTTGVSALVLNVTATNAAQSGFLRAEPTGTVPSTSTVNYTLGTASANTVIVPLGADGSVSIFTNTASDIVVDVTGYISSVAAPTSAAGRFVALVTGRAYDSRNTPAGAVPSGGIRTVQLAGLAAPAVPVDAAAISINLTAADEAAAGFLTAFPAGGTLPPTSTLNYVAGQPVANGALLKMSAGGALDVYALNQSSVIVDINGYFTG